MSGYTRIPNTIIESMFTEMNATEQAMCLYLCRYTYGMKNRSEFKVTKADFVNAKIGSKPSVYKNWDSKTLAKFFKRDGNLWVTKVNLSSKSEVKKVYPESKESLPQGYQKFTQKSKESLPSTSGLKKEKESLKEKIKESARESQPVQEVDLAPSLSFQQRLDNQPPHLRHEFINTEYSRLKQRKPLLIKALNSTASNPTAGNYKINVLKFEDKFPQATAESVIEWHSRGWFSTWQYKNEPRDKPEMGTITLAYVHPKSADERRAFESVETFLASESQENKPEKWVIDAYVKSGVKKSGLKKSQIKPAAQEVMKYATVTA